MPTIANPPTPSALRDLACDEVHPITTSVKGPRSIAVQWRVFARRRELTTSLAEGADPTSSPELALRAVQLTSARSRRQLARTLRRTIAEARKPSMTRSRVTIVPRSAVLDAEAAISALIELLGSPEPVTAEGMAMVEQLLTDSDSSPLYNSAEPGTLRRRVLAVIGALDPRTAGWRIAA